MSDRLFIVEFYSGPENTRVKVAVADLCRGIMIVVRAFRVLLTILYASYLTNVGLLLMLLPWSDGWSRLVLLLSPQMGVLLDSPIIRGTMSAFGFLHLALLVAELVAPSRLHEHQP